MPGLDYEVHPLTVAGKLAGCHSKPRPKSAAEGGGYFAPDRRYFPDGSFEAVCVWVPHEMSTACNYDQAISPERCEGCEHVGNGKAYVEDIRRRGT